MTSLRDIHPNTLAGIGLLMSVASVLFYFANPHVFVIMLFISLLIDQIVKRIRQSPRYARDQSAKLADWTSDRLAEGVIFTIAWKPWLFLFVINCFLTLYSFVKKETFILPLRQLFLLYFILSVILHILPVL